MTESAGETNPNRPWESEPDEWSGNFHGIDCLALRSWVGSWNAYARVPITHPFFGLHYGQHVRAPEKWREHNSVDELGIVSVFSMVLADRGGEGPADGYAPIKGLIGVHQGLTFAGELSDREGWYLGFDCSHTWDLQPQLVRHLEEMGAPEFILAGHRALTYRTLDYVIHNLEHLAQQLVDLSVVSVESEMTMRSSD